MKKIIIYSTFLHSLALHSCPTCVGKVTSASIPFFSSEFYQPGKPTTSSVTAAEYGKKELQKLIDESKGKK